MIEAYEKEHPNITIEAEYSLSLIHILEELERETRTTILYEAPHRLIKTLELLKDRLGEQRKICLLYTSLSSMNCMLFIYIRKWTKERD